MFYVVWQPFILSLGISVVSLGIIQSVINLSTAAGLIVWGILSDKIGRKPVMLASNLFRILALSVLLFSGELVWLLVFAFFVGFSSLFMQQNPAYNALVSESVTGERRATAFSVLMSISQIAGTVSASAGGYIAVTSGFYPVFYICLVADALGFILLSLFLKESLNVDRIREESESSLFIKLKAFFMPKKGIISLYIIMILWGFGYFTGNSLLYGTLVDSYDFNPIQLGLLTMSFNLIIAITVLPLGRASDRYGRLPFIKASYPVAVIGILGFIAFKRFEAFMIFNIVRAIDASLWISSWSAMVSEKVHPNERSTTFGKLDSYTRLASIPAPWLGGILYNFYGFTAPLIFYLLLTIIAGAIVLSLKNS